MTNETSAMSAYSGDTPAGRSLGELIDLLIRDEDRAPRNLIDRCAQCGKQWWNTCAQEWTTIVRGNPVSPPAH